MDTAVVLAVHERLCAGRRGLRRGVRARGAGAAGRFCAAGRRGAAQGRRGRAPGRRAAGRALWHHPHRGADQAARGRHRVAARAERAAPLLLLRTGAVARDSGPRRRQRQWQRRPERALSRAGEHRGRRIGSLLSRNRAFLPSRLACNQEVISFQY
jgi:hypothetical protein